MAANTQNNIFCPLWLLLFDTEGGKRKEGHGFIGPIRLKKIIMCILSMSSSEINTLNLCKVLQIPVF